MLTERPETKAGKDGRGIMAHQEAKGFLLCREGRIVTNMTGGLPATFGQGKGSRSIDRRGQRYGQLIVISHAGKDKHGRHLWLCRCDCDNECIYSAGKLTAGKAVSCGCVWTANKRTLNKRAGWKRKPYGESSFNALYYQYKYNARIRNRAFNLDEETFRQLTSQPCYHCGQLPKLARMTSGKTWGNGKYTYNGLDRIDNNRGYEIDNVRPCCKQCNQAKGTQSEASFMAWVQLIAAYTAARSARFEHGEGR